MLFQKGNKFGFKQGNKFGVGNKNVLGKHWKIKDTSRMSLAKKGKIPKNLEVLKKTPRTEEWKKRISESVKRTKHSSEFIKKMNGRKPWNWIKDRTMLVKKQERNDVAYKEWRTNVWKRDSWKCKINNCDCYGRIESHHILSWKDFPELRYDVNNGITLCHAHHPRIRAEEKRLIAEFRQLVSVSK